MKQENARLLCRKCMQELPEHLFLTKWAEEAKERGHKTAICLSCADWIGLYTCKSCGQRLPLENFSLAEAGDWASVRERSARHELSESCLCCQRAALECGGLKTKQEKRKMKELKADCFDAFLREAKTKGMSYGQYKAYLRRKELKRSGKKGTGC